MEPLTSKEVASIKAAARKIWANHESVKKMPVWFPSALMAIAVHYKKKYAK